MEAPAEHQKGLQSVAAPQSTSDFEFEQTTPVKKSLGKRIQGIVWDSLDKDPAERKLIAKLDWWILSYVCIAYFVKYLDQTNVSSHAIP
jgi:ACS family pantothenate transporter-like MFS transporter